MNTEESRDWDRALLLYLYSTYSVWSGGARHAEGRVEWDARSIATAIDWPVRTVYRVLMRLVRRGAVVRYRREDGTRFALSRGQHPEAPATRIKLLNRPGYRAYAVPRVLRQEVTA